ncbi:MAG: hypothetical protein QNJ68_15040 [Microcoleaceae cyanobacterium MO_207.B10]|nr:hypothetical protein [Microcoleaceae cyanobacterium MO_207.B10]
MRDYAYKFYQIIGLIIVGVMPDTNLLGKRDIWITKKIIVFLVEV